MVVRLIGSQPLRRAWCACTGSGFPHQRVSTGCHYIVIALTNSINSLDTLDSLALNSQAIAEAAWRNVPPRLMMAHAIRASLLATATVTTRAGRLASNALIHAASSGLFLA